MHRAQVFMSFFLAESEIDGKPHVPEATVETKR
jgi:hypothetical protein